MDGVMIGRYTRPEMGAIWSEQHKYECWLKVELAAAEALAELGEVPTTAAQSLRAHAGFDLNRIREIESEVRHDVIAFTTAVSETMRAKGASDASRWLHYGLTSNDVVDTAQALQIKSASDLIAHGLDTLSAALRKLAFEHRDTVEIGRTHGMHAEPITFGLKAALWWDEFTRHRTRFATAAEEMRAGKISGAVGTFAHIGPEAEEKICARLGLKSRADHLAGPSRGTCMHIIWPRWPELLQAWKKSHLKSATCSAPKFGKPKNRFRRTEGLLGDASQTQSRNGGTDCGLARVVRANTQAAFEKWLLWHERDISSFFRRTRHSAGFHDPDRLFTRKTTWLVSGFVVDATNAS